MTSEELEKIIARHEMRSLELKESFNAECIETACAFTNASGGYVVIGVDNAGRPSKHQLRFEGLRDYENKIETATEPSVAVDAEKLMFGGREVVVLKVAENPLKPVAYKGRCYIRKGSVNHQMTPSEIAECHLKSTGGSMDAVTVDGVTRNDLDMDAVRRYMKRSVEKGRRSYAADDDPWEVLLKLEWVKSDTAITRAAYLLFAKDTQRKFPQAIVHSGAFRSAGAIVVDSLDSKGNIQDQVDDAMAFIKRNIHCALVITPGKVDHDPMWDYPLEAVRETLANAICHRDYGAPYDIQVKISEDSLRVSSPGQLPFDMPMEFLMNPAHSSRPRNKIIAQAFFDMGIIERYGSGIKRIKGDCDKNGNPYPEWTDQYGEFATTYRPREIGAAEYGTENLVPRNSPGKPQSADDALKTALKAALKNSGKNDDDAIVSKILEVYRKISENPHVTLGAVAQEMRLSERTVDDYVSILKNSGALRRKDGKKFGVWETLM